MVEAIVAALPQLMKNINSQNQDTQHSPSRRTTEETDLNKAKPNCREAVVRAKSEKQSEEDKKA